MNIDNVKNTNIDNVNSVTFVGGGGDLAAASKGVHLIR